MRSMSGLPPKEEPVKPVETPKPVDLSNNNV
jgi:hypothetical protein